MREVRSNNKKENIAPIDQDLTSLEKVILSKIKDKPMTLNELIFVLQGDKSEILETISVMELKGDITNVGGILSSQRGLSPVERSERYDK